MNLPMKGKLSPKQLLWLETRGGRTAHDVFEKDGKLFVEMTNLKGHPRMGLMVPYKEVPKSKDIHLERVKLWDGKYRIRRTDYWKNVS